MNGQSFGHHSMEHGDYHANAPTMYSEWNQPKTYKNIIKYQKISKNIKKSKKKTSKAHIDSICTLPVASFWRLQWKHHLFLPPLDGNKETMGNVVTVGLAPPTMEVKEHTHFKRDWSLGTVLPLPVRQADLTRLFFRPSIYMDKMKSTWTTCDMSPDLMFLLIFNRVCHLRPCQPSPSSSSAAKTASWAKRHTKHQKLRWLRCFYQKKIVQKHHLKDVILKWANEKKKVNRLKFELFNKHISCHVAYLLSDVTRLSPEAHASKGIYEKWTTKWEKNTPKKLRFKMLKPI